MSTRCQIGIYENADTPVSEPRILLYVHSDGYPDGDHGIPARILPFLKRFDDGRGLSDADYLGARLIQHLCNLHDKSLGNSPHADTYRYLSYGICPPTDFHGDIEFYYAINCSTKELYVFECSFDADPGSYQLIETHPIR